MNWYYRVGLYLHVHTPVNVLNRYLHRWMDKLLQWTNDLSFTLNYFGGTVYTHAVLWFRAYYTMIQSVKRVFPVVQDEYANTLGDVASTELVYMWHGEW